MQGSGIATALLNSHSPDSANSSMSRLVRSRTSDSSSATCFGAKSGSSSRRYFTWSGWLICNGMSGRTLPMEIASMSLENTSGLRSACCVSSWRAMITPKSVRETGESVRSDVKMGCGLLAVSSSRTNAFGSSSASVSGAGSVGSMHRC